MKHIQVLWLVEHIARELDVACAVQALARKRYGLEIEIRNVYYHAKEMMQTMSPDIVVLPFFYTSTDLAYDDFIATWPESTFVNLSWEQIHYQAHEQIKAPSDEFAKKEVFHHTWGASGQAYLTQHGVPSEHIFVNGNPTYQLYKKPYSTYFKSRQEIARDNGLDPDKKWIFLPENYRWAFVTQSKIERWISRGSKREHFEAMRTFCIDSLKIALTWCNEMAANENVEMIFRPRPATSLSQITDFMEQNVGTKHPRLHVLKTETVREWILASDVVISSFSTTMIEAAVAEKQVMMLEPIPVPQELHCDWYKHLPRIKTQSEFAKLADGHDIELSTELRDWALANMLANGDPISNLVDFVSKLHTKVSAPSTWQKLTDTLKDALGGGATKPEVERWIKDPKTRKEKNYFNTTTHENDVFDSSMVSDRTARWAKIL